MINFYDLPSKAAYAPGTMMTWRARYAINLKNLPYQTVYVELPDIEALAKRIGTAPASTKSDGVSPFYTIPIIQDNSTGAVLTFADAVSDAFDHLRLPLFYSDLVVKTNARTAIYMREKFSSVSSLEAPEDKERKRLWAITKEKLAKMNKCFEESEGDFVMGSEPCFADTVLCGFLWFMRRMVGEESEEWETFISWNEGRWAKHLENFRPYEKIV
ncbi:uncharacterized protein EV420DRAFT_1545226 [Desarmillaria tabescens]|uniref:Glutathione S-transferase UstS-like C-terminal domain-containing protein n=1 Tax=Armillaria tabescens TaxID=1929756 RepID=A0AA39N4T3_ARMTA|nr:uncharacterized protein EV420DRAFT_1545226 [Desarmillaria tabescens]KAK0457907.1 hypothetical protein EV420DRAFT_1545226 [Desarmillaria tabescens]